jgi:hypothetical protein
MLASVSVLMAAITWLSVEVPNGNEAYFEACPICTVVFTEVLVARAGVHDKLIDVSPEYTACAVNALAPGNETAALKSSSTTVLPDTYETISLFSPPPFFTYPPTILALKMEVVATKTPVAGV